jgi:signal transduction histidine kinase
VAEVVRAGRFLSLPLLPVAVGYVCAHVALEWLSSVHPFGAFGIAPWNPSAGLIFILVLLFGRRTLPIVFAAVLVSNLFNRVPTIPFWASVAESLIVGLGYGSALLLLLRPAVRFDASLSSLRDLLLLLAAAVAGSAAVSSVYVALLEATGLVPHQHLSATLLRYWVGDMIGIAVVTPLGLLAFGRKRLLSFDVETLLQIVSTIALTFWVAAVFADSRQLQLFYLLFLPVTWVAVRSGLEGVCMALMSIQIGLVAAFLIFPISGVGVLAFQAQMLVLAITGLIAGVLVSERRMADAALRMNQDALARFSRLGSMGELAAAVAHEINQPLSAAGTYTGLVAESLERETLRDPATYELAQKAAVQIGRAADVVRRLRALVRLGRSELKPNSLARVVQEAVALAGEELDRHDIALSVEVPDGLPPIMADRLQIEQVLLNLIRNSVEAIVETGEPGRIVIAARRDRPGFVALTVRDSGPGFPPDLPDDLPLPMTTTKIDGLGIGLALCRSIAEAHGGSLSIGTGGTGALVTISLPVAEVAQHA